jgi:tetratricopeptide (TPR) repeat protein
MHLTTTPGSQRCERMRRDAIRVTREVHNEYETRATFIAVAWPELVPICDNLARTAEEEGERFRFLATAIAFNGYRRDRQFSRARSLLESISPIYGGIPLLAHFQAMAMQGSGIEGLRRGVTWAEQAHRLLPDNPGATHTNAVAIADLCDAGGISDPAAERRELEGALLLVDDAIRVFPNRARFYHTRARIRRRLRDYDSARSDLDRAIEIEPRTDLDSRERIATYLIERSLVDSDRAVRAMIDEAQATSLKLTSQTELLRRDLAESQIKVVEVIGFVGAVLGLVIATGSTFGSRPMPEALLLLAGMAVILLSAVAVGSWILQRALR